VVAAGSGFDIDRLKRVTRAAFLRLAAVLSEGSATPARVDT
jgi:hypothetical protein